MSKSRTKGDKMKSKYALPKNIKRADLKYPSNYKKAAYVESFSDLTGGSGFELWYTERFGWVVPTLFIHKARGEQATHRSYGVALDGGYLVRVGNGPHILEKHKVYFTKKNKTRLKKNFESVIRNGAIAAHDCRDRISTRRAQARDRKIFYGF